MCTRYCRQRDEAEGYASDAASASTIHLAGGPYNGMVLYLREVSSYLALVCLIKSDSFDRKGEAFSCDSWRLVFHSDSTACAGLLDYNITVFKSALSSVLDMSRRSGPVGAGAGAAAGTASA
jgi:hypothetical protein